MLACGPQRQVQPQRMLYLACETEGKNASRFHPKDVFPLVWSRMNRQKMKWAFFAPLTILFCLSPSCLAAHHDSSAKNLYQQGQNAEASDDPITAYEDYAQAFHKDPKNLRYKTAYERLRFTAASAHVARGEKLSAQGDSS